MCFGQFGKQRKRTVQDKKQNVRDGAASVQSG